MEQSVDGTLEKQGEQGLGKTKKKKQPKRREKLKQRNIDLLMDDFQDDLFFYIAGYTSGGAPYGVTWEELGLELYKDLEMEEK